MKTWVPALDFLVHVGFSGFLLNGSLENGIFARSVIRVLVQICYVGLMQSSGVGLLTLWQLNVNICDWVSEAIPYPVPFICLMVPLLASQGISFLVATRGYMLGYQSLKLWMKRQRDKGKISQEIIDEMAEIRARTKAAIAASKVKRSPIKNRAFAPTIPNNRAPAPVILMACSSKDPVEVPMVNLMNFPAKAVPVAPTPPPPPPPCAPAPPPPPPPPKTTPSPKATKPAAKAAAPPPPPPMPSSTSIWPVNSLFKKPGTTCKQQKVTPPAVNAIGKLQVRPVPEKRRAELLAFLGQKPTAKGCKERCDNQGKNTAKPSVQKLVTLFEKKNLFGERKSSIGSVDKTVCNMSEQRLNYGSPILK